jgi:hypothetical protein
LQAASILGYKLADDEVAQKDPENSGVSSSTTSSNVKQQTTDARSGYSSIKHNIPQSADISGEYSGWIIRYDYSGRHILSKSKLKVSLANHGSSLQGKWSEEGMPSIKLKAQVADTGLIFSPAGYDLKSHYFSKSGEYLEFRQASLALTQSPDATEITGNLQLYSTTQLEPAKPIYISLTRLSKITTDLKDSRRPLIAYPNPFEHTLTLEYLMTSAEDVVITLVDMSGKEVYKQTSVFEKGTNIFTIHTAVPAGYYVLKLAFRKEIHSTMVIKQ